MVLGKEDYILENMYFIDFLSTTFKLINKSKFICFEISESFVDTF